MCRCVPLPTSSTCIAARVSIADRTRDDATSMGRIVEVRKQLERFVKVCGDFEMRNARWTAETDLLAGHMVIVRTTSADKTAKKSEASWAGESLRREIPTIEPRKNAAFFTPIRTSMTSRHGLERHAVNVDQLTVEWYK